MSSFVVDVVVEWELAHTFARMLEKNILFMQTRFKLSNMDLRKNVNFKLISVDRRLASAASSSDLCLIN